MPERSTRPPLLQGPSHWWLMGNEVLKNPWSEQGCHNSLLSDWTTTLQAFYLCLWRMVCFKVTHADTAGHLRLWPDVGRLLAYRFNQPQSKGILMSGLREFWELFLNTHYSDIIDALMYHWNILQRHRSLWYWIMELNRFFGRDWNDGSMTQWSIHSPSLLCH